MYSKLIAALDGQQGKADASSLEIPVRITGSWDRPTFRPELKGVLSNPGKAVETIKEIGKKFKGKNADQIVDKLFGKEDGDDADPKRPKGSPSLPGGLGETQAKPGLLEALRRSLDDLRAKTVIK